MPDQWYFAWNNNRFGPFTASEFKELAKLGRLQPTDIVWKEGVAAGVVAREVRYLFPDKQAIVQPRGTPEASPMPTTSPSPAAGPANPDAGLASLPTATADRGHSTRELVDILPDKLTLRAIEGTDDTHFLASPWTKAPVVDRPM